MWHLARNGHSSLGQGLRHSHEDLKRLRQRDLRRQPAAHQHLELSGTALADPNYGQDGPMHRRDRDAAGSKVRER